MHTHIQCTHAQTAFDTRPWALTLATGIMGSTPPERTHVWDLGWCKSLLLSVIKCMKHYCDEDKAAHPRAADRDRAAYGTLIQKLDSAFAAVPSYKDGMKPVCMLYIYAYSSMHACSYKCVHVCT